MRSPGLTSSTDSPRTLPSSRCGFSSVNDLNWEFKKKKKRVKVRTVLFQSSIPGLPGVYSALNPFSSVRMPGYNQLAANPLLQQQYAAAPGLGNYYPPRWLTGVVSVTWTCRKTRARDATWLSLSNSFHPVSYYRRRFDRNHQLKSAPHWYRQRSFFCCFFFKFVKRIEIRRTLTSRCRFITSVAQLPVLTLRLSLLDVSLNSGLCWSL